MNTVTIKQQDNILQTDGTNVLAYQHSSNITLYLNLEKDGIFNDLVKTVTVNIPGLDRTISCNTDWSKAPAVVTLPQDVFKCEGMIYIALFGTDDTGLVINTNSLGFQIDESNSTITVECSDDKLLEQKVIDVMMQWYEVHVKADYEELQQKSKDQQVAVSQRIEAFDDKEAEIDTMVKNGDFDGATILEGIIDPPNELGKDGDVYINVSTSSYHLFFKENGVWVDKGTIRGLSGDNKILVGDEYEMAESKTLFIQKITDPLHELTGNADTVTIPAIIKDDGTGLFPSDTTITYHNGEPLSDILDAEVKHINVGDKVTYGDDPTEYDLGKMLFVNE